MIQATRIPGSPSDHQAPRRPAAPNSAPGGLDLWGWLRHWGDLGRQWLKRCARSLGIVTGAPSGAAAANRTPSPPPAPQPISPATREPELEDAPGGFSLSKWLKHFVVYLGAVAAICWIGLFFLWQIPFLKDPSQLFRIMDDNRTPRSVATATSPAPLATPTIPATPTPAVPVPPPVNPVVAPSQPPTPTDAVATMTTTAPTDAIDVQPSSEVQPAATPGGQAEQAATPPAETTAEPVPPSLPTPQAEIDQLLATAEQQMGNRRFTAPVSGNALSTYRRILELQPDHPTAIEAIQRITSYYRDIAQQSLQQGRLDESLAYINRGLRATPQSDDLLKLRQQVQQAQKVARQREREAQQKQQAALEEMQRQQLEQIEQEQLLPQQTQQQQPWWRQPPNYNESGGFNQR